MARAATALRCALGLEAGANWPLRTTSGTLLAVKPARLLPRTASLRTTGAAPLLTAKPAGLGPSRAASPLAFGTDGAEAACASGAPS